MPRRTTTAGGDFGNLVIVESPAKAKTIERYLGPGYRVVASYGHVRDLPAKALGVDIDHDFAPRYEPLKDRRRELDKLATEARRATLVWLATDLDREGESIAWHIAEYAGLPADRIQRVTFSEITKSAIDEAFAHPRTINLDLVNAQQARRVIDRLVGYKLSPLVASKIRRGLSAGRVQSVAVRVVVEREREIGRFVAEEYWSIEAVLRRASGGATFRAELSRIDGEKVRIGSEGEAREHEAALRSEQYTVESVAKTVRRRSAQPPFTTSTLQQEASRKLGFGASRTMRAAQSLYEGVALPGGQVGLITYMRTDSVAIAGSAVADARAVIGERYGERVRAQAAEHLPEPVPGSPGGARGRATVKLRANTGLVANAPQARRIPSLRADLEARHREPDGSGSLRPGERGRAGWPIHAARGSREARLRRLPGRLRRGARRRGGRAPRLSSPTWRRESP